jgi:hypothetical protein
MSDPNWFWIGAMFGVVLYCIVQAVRDLRAKQYGWAIAAMLSATVLLTMPIQSHAVKVTIPQSR